MQILRYQYPQWPGHFDGQEQVTELGTFDFSLSEVHELLLKEQSNQEKELWRSAARRNTFAVLLKNVEWVEQGIAGGEDVVVWWYPRRDVPVEEHQKEQKRLESLELAGSSDSQAYYAAPPGFEDFCLGLRLAQLIYGGRYFRCACPKCDADYLPEACRIEKWFGGSMGGLKVACPQGHTLHAQMTFEA